MSDMLVIKSLKREHFYYEKCLHINPFTLFVQKHCRLLYAQSECEGIGKHRTRFFFFINTHKT